MQRRALGSTGITVSPIGLGTVKLGRNAGVKYPQGFELPSDEDAAALLGVARGLGLNLIDTAPAYGTSEARLGELLASGRAGRRDDWVIVTKAGEGHDGRYGSTDFSPEAVAASVHRSLRRLRTPHLDAVLLHPIDDAGEGELESSGAVDALRALREQGKVRAIGASTRTTAGAMAALAWSDMVMLTLNPDHLHDLPAIEHARQRGVGVLIKKALLSGHVGRGAGRTPEDCLRFALHTPGVSSVVVGTINTAHLRANVAAAQRALWGDAEH